jgi:hypothetical protein
MHDHRQRPQYGAMPSRAVPWRWVKPSLDAMRNDPAGQVAEAVRDAMTAAR